MIKPALWYKNAIFYELSIRAFCDGNADGIGDFRGATQKLDYLSDLGITCIWLLPFYPSPLKDDGYDIADYYGVHSDYGTIADCRAFLAAAHERGIRIIADLVLNHTSDQHPWFREACASPTSPKHDYYVWSDTADKYHGVRVIFTDFETSNWAWHPETKAYYWHRFYRHQPDLNYDNPYVRQEMLQVARFWLDLGMDGFRCDAVPHLFEREGTSCEGLPETHAYFKELRRDLERTHPECLLLGEANQWPREAAVYFGDGDEFHMAFHFPLVIRLFLALARRNREPVVDILAQTPIIPTNCQWALFLRYVPIICDPAVSYHHINVEAQLRDQHSLLSWLKQLIAIRKNVPAFAHGTVEMISSSNTQVLTYLYQYDGEAVMIIGNLSGQGQYVELDLRQFTGAVPLDVLNRHSLSPIDAQPYILTLAPYGFYWLRLPQHTGV